MTDISPGACSSGIPQADGLQVLHVQPEGPEVPGQPHAGDQGQEEEQGKRRGNRRGRLCPLGSEEVSA